MRSFLPYDNKTKFLKKSDEVSVMAWCAQRERENLIERTKVGIQRAKAEGKHCGRPFKEIDWKFVDLLHENGMNYKEIAEKIKVPYVTLMRRKQR